MAIVGDTKGSTQGGGKKGNASKKGKKTAYLRINKRGVQGLLSGRVKGENGQLWG